MWGQFQSLIAWLKRLIGTDLPRSIPGSDDLGVSPLPLSSTEETDDWSWLHPPRNVDDKDAWDQYWQNQFKHSQGFCFLDLFSDDRELVEAIRGRDGRTVLCVGNGVSMEPWALSEAGLEVTALDVSSVATHTARSIEAPPEALEQYIDLTQRQPGGFVQFVVGDLFDVSACPGPFDAIIERRTVQLFDDADRARALESLVGRLGAGGIVFSQCHDGWSRPPAKPVHAAEAWFRAREEIAVLDNWELRATSGQVAWLLLTTG